MTPDRRRLHPQLIASLDRVPECKVLLHIRSRSCPPRSGHRVKECRLLSLFGSDARDERIRHRDQDKTRKGQEQKEDDCRRRLHRPRIDVVDLVCHAACIVPADRAHTFPRAVDYAIPKACQARVITHHFTPYISWLLAYCRLRY